jgi:hypothetical protein
LEGGPPGSKPVGALIPRGEIPGGEWRTGRDLEDPVRKRQRVVGDEADFEVEANHRKAGEPAADRVSEERI